MYLYWCVENFDCLRVDLTKDDKSIGTVTGRHAKKEFSPLHKPEVVIIEGMAEKTFNMEMKSVMRKLGYSGFLENVRHGKGTAFFVRNDKEKEIATSNSVRFYITLSFSLNKESPLIGLIWIDQRDLELYFLKDLCLWKRSVFSLVQSCYFVNESVLMCLL